MSSLVGPTQTTEMLTTSPAALMLSAGKSARSMMANPVPLGSVVMSYRRGQAQAGTVQPIAGRKIVRCDRGF